jgi:two-component system response regulator HydG
VRIIVASNERLSVACRHGKFREDLYHRFNEFSIDLPPLRARKEDIALFANRFLQETAQQLNKTVEGFTPEVLQLLQAYPWYGNVRELKNVVKRAALLTDTAWVQPQALPFEIVYHQKLDAAPEPSEPTLVGVSLPKEPLAEPTTYSAPTQTPAAPPPIPAHTDLKAASQHAEYTRILEALQSTHYNKSKAAELLGIDRKTLYNKLKQYNVKF